MPRWLLFLACLGGMALLAAGITLSDGGRPVPPAPPPSQPASAETAATAGPNTLRQTSPTAASNSALTIRLVGGAADR